MQNQTKYTPEELNMIYEAVLNQVEEAVVISDEENKVVFINRAAEVIEGVDAKKSLNKSMEELYSPTENTPKHSRHAIVLNTGIAEHAAYLRDKGGIQCVAIGTDFDGIEGNLEIADCAGMELLAQALRRRGFTESELEMVFWKNVLRVMKEAMR